MTRAFIVVVGFCLLLVSCTQQLVCPAYQSAYIYDKDALRKKFSYFNEDSTPKIYASATNKNRYLIAEPTSFKKKARSLQTVPAKKVNTVLPDSLNPDKEVTGAELDLAAQSIIDSTYIVDVKPADSLQAAEDSVYVITIDREMRILKYNFPDSLKYDPVTGKYVPEKPKYYVEEVGYNTEQDNYMWYLRDVLLLPDAKLSQEAQSNEKEAGSAKKKKGIKGFFAGLFKKKDKKKVEQDSTLTETPLQEEDYGYDDFEGKATDSTTVQTQTQQPPAPKQKKGMFSFLKKDKTEKKKKTETPPAKKEEEKDDGF
jgi:hypothetical protein